MGNTKTYWQTYIDNIKDLTMKTYKDNINTDQFDFCKAIDNNLCSKNQIAQIINRTSGLNDSKSLMMEDLCQQIIRLPEKDIIDIFKHIRENK